MLVHNNTNLWENDEIVENALCNLFVKRQAPEKICKKEQMFVEYILKIYKIMLKYNNHAQTARGNCPKTL